MKKKLLITGIAVIVVLATVFALAACNDTLSDGIFSGGCIAVMDEYGRWGYVDSNGKEVIGFDYNGASAFVNDVAIVVQGQRFFLIDKDGEKIGGPYTDIGAVADNTMIILANKEGKYGVYDTAAKAFSYDFVYDAITPVGDTSVVRMESKMNGIAGVEYVDLATGSVTMARKTDEVTYVDGNDGAQNFFFYNAKENNTSVVKAVNVLTGVEAGTWNGGNATHNGWRRLLNNTYNAEGTVESQTYHYVTDTALIALDINTETALQKRDGSMLVTEKSAEGADGAIVTTYTIYGKDGASIYSGTAEPQWVTLKSLYGVATYTEEEGYTLKVFKDGAAFTASYKPEAGAESVSVSSWNIDEEGNINFTIGYDVTVTEGENTTTESISKNLVSIGGTTVEIPEEYTYVGVSGGKLILADKARARVGVFNTDMSAVTECIYDDAEVCEGGYIRVSMGECFGVLAPDGSTVLDCVYYGIAVA